MEKLNKKNITKVQLREYQKYEEPKENEQDLNKNFQKVFTKENECRQPQKEREETWRERQDIRTGCLDR